jgi:succinate dehydrogenase/fumarate reductase cytochrome b subunit
MQRMRKSLKILHSLSACGLIGGLAAHMVLLVAAQAETPDAYSALRQAIAAISNYVLVPSLAVALVTGLLSMAVHKPFIDKGWVLLKAATGIVMFKGVLTVIAAQADHAARVAERVASGEVEASLLASAIAYEWAALWTVMALSVANVVLGVWRPRLSRRPMVKGHRAGPTAVETRTMPSVDKPAKAA